jgi:Phospholipase_D-nuclease N-terminal/Short C-terminal domain
MSFWEFMWLIFVSFCFVAYLSVLFHIIVDLFRDPGTSGWVKAIWVVTLIFVPVVTSLVYLIARGKGMAERQTQRVEMMRTQQEAYIRETAGHATPADQITQARALLDQGAITPTEYERLKAQALGTPPAPAPPRAV